jgi:hypothetical protein
VVFVAEGGVVSERHARVRCEVLLIVVNIIINIQMYKYITKVNLSWNEFSCVFLKSLFVRIFCCKFHIQNLYLRCGFSCV